jgi:hypothetical protein
MALHSRLGTAIAILTLFGLTACAFGSSSPTSPTRVPTQIAPIAGARAFPKSCPCLYVADRGNNSVTVYARARTATSGRSAF